MKETEEDVDKNPRPFPFPPPRRKINLRRPISSIHFTLIRNTFLNAMKRTEQTKSIPQGTYLLLFQL